MILNTRDRGSTANRHPLCVNNHLHAFQIKLIPFSGAEEGQYECLEFFSCLALVGMGLLLNN